MSNYLEQRFKEKLYGKAYEPKKQYSIPKKSKKKIEQEKAEKERLGGEDTDLVKFFKGAMKRMTGKCLWCGANTETHIYKWAIFSICHLLDKRETMCPSVKCHPRNWIELCPDHHTEFDSLNWTEREQLGFWPEIVERLISVYPDLDPSEHRHFPQSVLKIIQQREPF